MPIYCDNNTAIILSKDHAGHPWVKHIQVKYHYMRDQVQDGLLVAQLIRSEDNMADILMKPLGCVDFQCLRCYLGLCAWGGWVEEEWGGLTRRSVKVCVVMEAAIEW
jgi:hypothetical protein